METEPEQTTSALAEFQQAWSDGWNDRPKPKGASGMYKRVYATAKKERAEHDYWRERMKEKGWARA